MTCHSELTIPLPLPTLNTVIDISKRHWAEYKRSKGSHTFAVKVLALEAKLTPIQHRVSLRMDWHPANRRQDPDNIAAGGGKVILDGLVSAGVLPRDSWRWVGELHHYFHTTDPADPHVDISWEPMA